MGCGASSSKHRRVFRPIPDRFETISQVQAAVRDAGLESSNLIIGVDFTKSNKWTGKKSFQGQCLHKVVSQGIKTPYQRVMDVMGRTLEEFDDDKLIPAFGFGDVTTGDKACFTFNDDGVPSHGIGQVLQRYAEIASKVQLSGPTSFAPVIREAIKIVAQEGSYHILVIIADGQVTDPTPTGETARAIIEASEYQLSIICVGVGDGPWDVMDDYDDGLPERAFDNFQFVNYNKIVANGELSHYNTSDRAKIDAQFALSALMEIPDQYHFIKQTGMLNRTGVGQPAHPHHATRLMPPPDWMRRPSPVSSPPISPAVLSSPPISPAVPRMGDISGDYWMVNNQWGDQGAGVQPSAPPPSYQAAMNHDSASRSEHAIVARCHNLGAEVVHPTVVGDANPVPSAPPSPPTVVDRAWQQLLEQTSSCCEETPSRASSQGRGLTMPLDVHMGMVAPAAEV